MGTRGFEPQISRSGAVHHTWLDHIPNWFLNGRVRIWTRTSRFRRPLHFQIMLHAPLHHRTRNGGLGNWTPTCCLIVEFFLASGGVKPPIYSSHQPYESALDGNLTHQKYLIKSFRICNYQKPTIIITMRFNPSQGIIFSFKTLLYHKDIGGKNL